MKVQAHGATLSSHNRTHYFPLSNTLLEIGLEPVPPRLKLYGYKPKSQPPFHPSRALDGSNGSCDFGL